MATSILHLMRKYDFHIYHGLAEIDAAARPIFMQNKMSR